MSQKKEKFKIGIDMGGTKIESVILNEKNKEIFRERISTNQIAGNSEVLNQLDTLFKRTKKFIAGNSFTLGIGMPGRICLRTRKLHNSTILCQNNLKIEQVIQNKLQTKFRLENDAKCFTFAESTLGSGKNYSFVIGLIIGTGVGAGICINKKIINGVSNIAGEFGHTIIGKNEFDCFCGKNGCVNSFISGTAVEAQVFKKLKKKITSEVFLNKNKYSYVENKIIQNYQENFLIALSNLINTVDPEVIVLGGGISNCNLIYDKFIPMLNNFIYCEYPKTKVIKNKLGDSAGVIGAALIGK